MLKWTICSSWTYGVLIRSLDPKRLGSMSTSGINKSRSVILEKEEDSIFKTWTLMLTSWTWTTTQPTTLGETEWLTISWWTWSPYKAPKTSMAKLREPASSTWSKTLISKTWESSKIWRPERTSRRKCSAINNQSPSTATLDSKIWCHRVRGTQDVAATHQMTLL